MGQEPDSCDTTQIDVFTSARFTRHHACPMDNGWVPVGIYLVARSSRPRKSIRPAAPRPVSTIGGSLQVCRAGYSSFSQVWIGFTCWCYYMHGLLVCQPFFSHPTKRATDSSRPSAMHTTLFLFQCFHCLFQSLSLQCIGHPAQVVHIVHRCHQRKDRNHYASYQ